MGGGLPMPEFFGPLFRSAFFVNKKSLFLQKCQCIEPLNLEFWRPKKGPSCPNRGQGGRLGDLGNARKKTLFFIDVFPKWVYMFAIFYSHSYAPDLWNRTRCLEAVDRSAQTDGRVRSEPLKWVGRVWGHHTLSAHQVVWPCYTLLHLGIPCHTLANSVMLCHILSRLFTPFHTLSHLVIPRYIFSHHFNLVIPCQSTCLTREQLIVSWWLSQHTNWQIKIKPAFHKFKSNWRCH